MRGVSCAKPLCAVATASAIPKQRIALEAVRGLRLKTERNIRTNLMECGRPCVARSSDCCQSIVTFRCKPRSMLCSAGQSEANIAVQLSRDNSTTNGNRNNPVTFGLQPHDNTDRKSTRLNSSHLGISYAV